MWNLQKYKTKECIQQNRNRLTDIEKTSGYLWGEERAVGKDRDMGIRDTNYYVYNR